WAQRHPERLTALIRALYRASQWCELPANHAELVKLLAEPRYIGAPAEILLRGLSNRLTLVRGDAPQAVSDFYVPSRHAATFPWTSHALWFYSQMVRWRQMVYSPEHLPLVRATYRPDLYRLALASLGVNLPTHDAKIEGARTRRQAIDAVGGALDYGPDGFFDNRSFDPENLSEYLTQLGPS
ncbi:MAG TPA: hypothetical protein VET48_03255, partial [Steroidobacteraceae bacterium]|nr:hypothetical protein [Steroidobacteraceae bacterium]